MQEGGHIGQVCVSPIIMYDTMFNHYVNILFENLDISIADISIKV